MDGKMVANKSSGGNFWLKEWAEMNTNLGKNPEVGKYIGIYLAFGLGSSALTVCQTLILWIFCSIEVCSYHSRVVSVLQTDPQV